MDYADRHNDAYWEPHLDRMDAMSTDGTWGNLGGRTEDDRPIDKGKNEESVRQGKSDPKNAPGQDDTEQRGPV